MQKAKNPEAPPARRSECAAASLRREIEIVKKMSVEQRILAALDMKSKFTWVEPTPIKRSR